jgi:hypothetical protein
MCKKMKHPYGIGLVLLCKKIEKTLILK